MAPKVWLITGCSSGFGKSLAEALLRENQWVVATARKPKLLEDLKTINPARLLTAGLDVTISSDIDQVVDRAVKQFGTLDVLVNNAGYGYYGTQEEANIEEVQMLFNTNVFGLARVTQAVLPIMRQAGSGCIVNVSSLGGRVALPFMGFYHASKHAVEAMSEALYFETCRFGIRVVVIEPGGHETRFSRSGIRSPALHNPVSPYAALFSQWRDTNQKIVPVKGDPKNMARAVISAVDGEKPFQRIPVGPDAEFLVGLRRNSANDDDFFNQMHNLYALGLKIS